MTTPESPAAIAPRLELRGGLGPEQPVWDDCDTYSAEWYRRFRDWHHAEFPEADEGTRDNLVMLIEWADRRG